ncbi:MAG: peptidylprolyl isomerase [Fimbriimonadales bacterium]|jgi:parvulin-like peptidyl-prolyl isomerase|nr:peptidylprolyl isomerase [Fimbriimonadales bacterium]GIV14122.1 MAG: hypothetical protein KatS3mg021_2404 [Fimbriimonadales bacterium]
MPITVRTFRNLLKRKLVRGAGLLVLILIALSMVIFFAYVPFMGARTNGGLPAELQRPVVVVGDFTLSEADLTRLINLQTQSSPPAEYGQLLGLRFQLAQQVGQQMALVQELKKRGFTASDDEIEQAKEEYLKQRLEQYRMQLLPEGKGTDSDLDKALRERGSSLKQLRERLLAEVPEFLFEAQVIGQKFTKSVEEKYAKPTDEQLRLMFEQIYPARIMVSVEKHKDKAEARAQEAYNALKAGKPFAEVVKQFSDDPEPIIKQGGRITGSGYYEILNNLSSLFSGEFAQRVLSLKPGEYTTPTPDKDKKAYYIFTIAERKLVLPKDFEQKKEDYRKSYAMMRSQFEQQAVFLEAMKNYKIEFKDAVLVQYEKLNTAFSQPAPQRLKALKEIDQALTPIVASSDPNLRLAQWLQIQVLNMLVATAKEVKDKETEKTYGERLITALNRFFAEGGEDLNLRLMRAERLLEAGAKQQALDDLEIASGLAFRPGDSFLQQRIAELYNKAGRKDLAQKAQKRAEELLKEQQRQFEEMLRRQIEAQKQRAAEEKKQAEAQKTTPGSNAAQSGTQGNAATPGQNNAPATQGR